MMCRFISALALSLLVSVSAISVSAHAETNWYGGLGAGAQFPAAQSVAGVNTTAPLSPRLTDRVTYSTGWNGYLSLGYAFENGWRAEGEIGAHRADVSSAFGDPALNIAALCVITVPNCAQLGPTGGRTTALSFMFNGFRDLPVGLPFIPHVGAGLGVANVHATNIGQPRGAVFGAPYLNSQSTVFAYQLIAGLTYRLSAGVAFDLDYRYFDTASVKFAPQTAPGSSTLSTGFTSHGVTAGVRLKF